MLRRCSRLDIGDAADDQLVAAGRDEAFDLHALADEGQQGFAVGVGVEAVHVDDKAETAVILQDDRIAFVLDNAGVGMSFGGHHGVISGPGFARHARDDGVDAFFFHTVFQRFEEGLAEFAAGLHFLCHLARGIHLRARAHQGFVGVGHILGPDAEGGFELAVVGGFHGGVLKNKGQTDRKKWSD